jgi:TolA-binding protein
MNFFVRAILLVTAAALILPESGVASIIFQPGKKAKFVAPGDEEISETALELYQVGQSAEKQGDVKRAIHAYKNIVRQYPKDALASSALYRTAQLQEALNFPAADSYRQRSKISCQPALR